MKIQMPRGTQDVLPSQSAAWQRIEATIRELCALYGLREIRTPSFEHTELFLRGVGDTTDVVQKQMYTFEDKGKRSITLRPEGTAGAIRAYNQHGLSNEGLPCKMYYLSASIFRYETPQSGRLREHHQFGPEIIGVRSATADAEIILLAHQVFERLGITGLSLRINSIGCPECRAAYHDELKRFYGERLGEMCETCRERFARNPLRILDCKEERCKRLTQDAPSMIDHLCGDCADHFAELKCMLEAHGLAYAIDPRIVRGLDYYTRTVFEIIMTQDDGSELTVCGGGRYDGLIEELGGAPTPAVGFGMGIERLIMVLEGRMPPEPPLLEVAVLTMGDEARVEGVKLVDELRAAGVRADIDHMARGFKAAFKWADRIAAPLVVVIAGDELAAGVVKLRDMRTSEQVDIPRGEAVEAVLQKREG